MFSDLVEVTYPMPSALGLITLSAYFLKVSSDIYGDLSDCREAAFLGNHLYFEHEPILLSLKKLFSVPGSVLDPEFRNNFWANVLGWIIYDFLLISAL